MANAPRIALTGYFAQMYGSWYPMHCVVGVMDDDAEAQQVVTDFHTAGFGVDAVRLFTGAEVTQIQTQIGAQRNPIQRVTASLTRGTDEGMAAAADRDEAAQGHHIVVVYVGKRDRPDPRRVAPVMPAMREVPGSPTALHIWWMSGTRRSPVHQIPRLLPAWRPLGTTASWAHRGCARSDHRRYRRRPFGMDTTTGYANG